jgi:fructoselysine-6-P-deglycase FrlB-like protein
MAGVSPDARAVVAPYVQLAAVERFAEHLAVLHSHPLSTRRYMGVVDY